MSFALPTPPRGSLFRVGYDDQGRVHFRWRRPVHWLLDFYVFAFFLGCSVLLVFFISRVFGPAPALAAAAILGAFKACVCLGSLESDRLTFARSWLRYEHEEPRKVGRRLREVSRAVVGAIRLDRVFESPDEPQRQRLTLDHGAEHMEIGRGLRASDLEWLAGVLRAWAAGKGLIPVGPPGVPFRPSIAVERDGDGVFRLHWMPSSRIPAPARWMRVVELFGRIAISELLPLLRGPTEEYLTLTPLAVHYQPGRYFVLQPVGLPPDGHNFAYDGLTVCSRPPREVALPEIGAIRLEQTDTGRRLVVGRGAEVFEVGPTLPDQDREWLAEILRAWAGIGDEEYPPEGKADEGQAVEAGTATGLRQ